MGFSFFLWAADDDESGSEREPLAPDFYARAQRGQLNTA
jgi:hypothetical protein